MKRSGISVGAKSLERGSTFKAARRSLPRHPMRRARRRHRPSDGLRERMADFKAAVSGHLCAGCGHAPAWGDLHAHHVVYRQHLPVEHAWDPRNALALCGVCHERHHNASRRIPLDALTKQNLEFADEVLGAAAGDYLARRYAPSAYLPSGAVG